MNFLQKAFVFILKNFTTFIMNNFYHIIIVFATKYSNLNYYQIITSFRHRLIAKTNFNLIHFSLSYLFTQANLFVFKK